MLSGATQDRREEIPPDAESDCQPCEAFTPVVVARLFHPWRNARKILLAVSGGPDSVALMLLAAAWARGCAASPRLHVATVDHGLRPEAGAEAEQVAEWARRLGLPHDTLVWTGAKPKSRIQERARQARYRLLFAHAARIGADVVATAHHADDQAETILFRLLRGSGPAGLSGMAASRARLGLTHARPLLQCSKAELIACCAAKTHPFLTDSSNSDPAYARTRMRALGRLLEPEGLGREALLRLGRRAARAEAALAARASAVAETLPAERTPGLYRADISSLAQEPDEIFLRVLAREIIPIVNPPGDTLGDSLVEPTLGRLRLERLETLACAMQAGLRASTPFSGTLGGAALKLGRDHMLTIRPEKPRRRDIAARREKLCDL
jgi:tRNA(Ile)-lysidine synthase